MKKYILVIMPNIGEQNIPFIIFEKWKPENISFLGDTVFFKVEETFFSMKKNEFCTNFPEKCDIIKN